MTSPPLDDSLVDSLLSRPESITFDCKRLGKLDKVLEMVVAFANTRGGVIALGLEDPDKGHGRDRGNQSSFLIGSEKNFLEIRKSLTGKELWKIFFSKIVFQASFHPILRCSDD